MANGTLVPKASNVKSGLPYSTEHADCTDTARTYVPMRDKVVAITQPMTGNDMVPAIKLAIVVSGTSAASSNACQCSAGSYPDKHSN